jgi:hypothetical protein
VKPAIAIAALLLLPVIASGQQSSRYEIRSWKTGAAQAEPQTLNIVLSLTSRTYTRVVNSISGRPLYRVVVNPAAFIGPGDGIVAWHVYLTTLDSTENLLLPSNSLEQEEYKTPDYLWWFYPGQNTLVPIDAARVIQVEGSYVSLRAEGVKTSGAGQLESMHLTITFSNTPPGG